MTSLFTKIIPVGVTTLVLVVSGCSDKSEKADGGAGRPETSGVVGTDRGDTTVVDPGGGDTGGGDTGGTKGSGETGGGETGGAKGSDLPADWPEDVPLPADLTSSASSSLDAGGRRTVIYGGETAMSTDDLEAFYNERLPGWQQIYSDQQEVSGVSVIGFTKDGRQLYVNISDNGNNRTLNLSYSPG